MSAYTVLCNNRSQFNLQCIEHAIAKPPMTQCRLSLSAMRVIKNKSNRSGKGREFIHAILLSGCP